MRLSLAISCSNGLVALASAAVNLQGWVDFAPLARGPRKEGGIGAIGDDIYDLGGQDFIGAYDWVEVFNVNSNTWRNASNLPEQVTHLNVQSYNGHLYVLGSLNVVLPWWNATASCWEYDPVTDTWSDLPPLPDVARGASAVALWEDTIYVAGGTGGILLELGGGFSVTTTAVSAFNVTSREWSILPDLPEPREHFGGAVIDGVLYVLGGRSVSATIVHNTTYALDLKAENPVWVTKAPMPTPRGGHLTSFVDSIIYTFGGESDPVEAGNLLSIYNNTEAYDTTTDTWEELEPMPLARHGTGAVAVDRCNFIPGGGIIGDYDFSLPTDANTAFCV